MKIKSILIPSMLLSACFAYADETSFDTSLGGIIMNNGVWQNLDKFSNGTPTPSTDFLIKGAFTRVLGTSTLEVNNLILYNGSGSILTVTSDQENSIKAGTFDYSTYVAPKLLVHGNLVSNGIDNARLGSAEYRAGFNQIVVEGDVEMTNAANNFRFGFDPNQTYSENYYALDVGGQVKLTKASQRFIINRFGGEGNTHYSGMSLDVYARLGGLTGLGNIVNNDPGALFTQIVFQAQSGKTFSGGDWTGELRADSVGTNSVIKVVMNDLASSNTQTLRVKLPGTTSLLKSLDFEVRSGKLGLYTYSDMKVTSINMTGGDLLIQGYNESYDAGYGEINTSKIELGGGKIHFDVGNDSMMGFYNDVIYADEISGDGSTQIVINLLGADFDLGDYIGFSDLKIFDSVQTSSIDWSAVSVAVKYNGMDVTSGLGININYNGTDAVLLSMSGVIPEASHYAAVLGLIALASTAVVRKKSVK